MKLVKLVFLFISVTAFSQSKVGTIDVDFVLSKMPELPALQKQIEDYGKQLDVDFNKKMEVYNALVTAYTAEEQGLTIAQKKTKQDEILKAEDEVNLFQQNGTKLLNIRRDELVRPLYQKIGVSLEKIAKAEAFTQVLELDERVVYVDHNYDLTIKVLADLGISIEEKKE
ncbi:periplasmic chaperone for outer membrane proteins Skp [Ulvibacter sp. MAR_2010_11]|uniref:OmpH family outer membrane protein n=1 Tax=Ulvibacter sp. MAR_2010_11 TaxID=1250229 RepID=UPI000C2C3170|nr:OmpH family outer membrane protein [Ulvibacter sp. MAR_2010_11]PKA82066.1 periplasmic chaperone for outer membrane proteins Skp [Ulvibacter sp. MAR_2010_11]